MKILIVEDETLARERLHILVKELYANADIAEAVNGLDALDKLADFRPEIILLDIRMPGMDGLELANHILNYDSPPAVVFTTAYQDHALSAFDANAVDYLLKPIRKDRLQTAIEKARVISHAKLTIIQQTEPDAAARKHLSAMIQGRLQLIAVENIYYLKAEQKYVTAAWPGGEILVDEPLVSLEQEFSHYFIRIHRNALAAKNYIDCLDKTSDGQAFIRLDYMPTELEVSRRHLAEVRSLIKQR